MFDTDILQEKIAYERWVQQEAVLVVKESFGIQSERTVVFHSNGKKEHKSDLHSGFGAKRGVEVLEKLSPLLFATSFKNIDMIFEWILQENLTEVKYPFNWKIKELEKLINHSDFKLPVLLSNERDLLNILFQLYKRLVPYRNKIVHGNWGYIQNENLVFDFTDGNRIFQLSLSFEEIINLSEAISYISEILIKSPENVSVMVETIKHILDKLFRLHEVITFNIDKPRFFEVQYELKENSIVNNLEIREHLAKEVNGNEQISYTLLVLGPSRKWKIPWEVIKNIHEIKLDQQWDKYLI